MYGVWFNPVGLPVLRKLFTSNEMPVEPAE